MKKSMKALLLAAMTVTALAGCSSKPADPTTAATEAVTTTAADSAADTTADTTAAEGAATEDGKSYTIGIGQFAEHGSLDNCREGFLQGLADEGIVEGQNLTILYENAQADGGTASQIINNFISKKADLICAIATPIAQAAYGGAKKDNVPVIYTAVTDPAAAALANEDGTPVGEVTGTSDKLPVEKQLEMIRKILPDAKKIGILYSTSEVNSETAIAEYKAAAPDYGFEIVEGNLHRRYPAGCRQHPGKGGLLKQLNRQHGRKLSPDDLRQSLQEKHSGIRKRGRTGQDRLPGFHGSRLRGFRNSDR